MTYFLADDETVDPAALLALQRRKLGAMLADVLPRNRFYNEKLASVPFDAAADSHTQLPLTTRAEIEEDQRRFPPYGSNVSYAVEAYKRVHQTSGTKGDPLRWLDTKACWDWWMRCWSIVFTAAGVTSVDRLFFPFSFGPFVGFWAAFEAASRLDCFVLPGGGMSTRARLQYLTSHDVTVICCTPTYALRMAEVARQERVDLAGSSVRALVVAGEPGGSIPATRARIESAWGARVFDHAGMTEIGAWGFECENAPGGLHVIESEFIAEVIDPATTEPTPDGEAGELVLTNLGRWGSPLIRYRTGDQVRLCRGQCACGRWFARAEGGVLGRLDDMMILRGTNVFPSAIESVVQSFDEVAEFGMVHSMRGELQHLRIEVEPVDRHGRTANSAVSIDLAQRLRDAIRDKLQFTPDVSLVAPGSLPRAEFKANRLRRE